ncbi:MAG: helix-turn-helix domain-containing protein [Candidatus Saccharimonadales bacterium]
MVTPRKPLVNTDPRLGIALRAFREQQKLSQEDLAHHAGITTPALSRIEGAKSNPSWATVMSILAALEVSLADLEAAIQRNNA